MMPMLLEEERWQQLNAGKLRGTGAAVWHTTLGTTNDYWCGEWSHRTPRQLLRECETIIDDLLRNHPELQRHSDLRSENCEQ